MLSIAGRAGGSRALHVPSPLESHALSVGPPRSAATILAALTRLKLELRTQSKICSFQAHLANWLSQVLNIVL